MSRELLESVLDLPPITPALVDIEAHFADHEGPRQPVINPHELQQTVPDPRTARPAAVLILLTPEQRGPGVVLTRRTEHLPHHPGQISFPGGRAENHDANLVATARREACEEISLQADADVTVLGRLGTYYTVTGFAVTPVIARSAARFSEMSLVPDPGEVAEIHCAPLAHLLDPGNYQVHESRYAGHLRHYYSVPWEGHNIWGATAGMLMGLYRELQAR